jgi:hypothetical protein
VRSVIVDQQSAEDRHLRNLGIPVIKRVPLEATITAENAGYLFTKAQRMNHLLNLGALSMVSVKGGNGAHDGAD